MHIALLEDDPDQRALLQLWLQASGHDCVGWDNLATFKDGFPRSHFDVLLLDWMLPDGSGLDALSWARQTVGWNVAVVVLTARDDETTVIQALQAGADDFVVKPAKQLELLARLTTAVRRSSPNGILVLKLGAYEVDLSRHLLSVQGQAQTMTQKEFDLAVYMFQNPGKLLSRDHLLNKIWGMNTEVDTRTVDTHVSRLRKKLKLDGGLGWKLGSVYGYGYRLDRCEV
jgi:two-component system response regulator RegX3